VATAFIAAFTFVVGIAGELGEQARFRTMTDPLVWTVGLAGVSNAFSHLLRARKGHEVDARTGA
jgi:hypothetical protein